MQGGVVEERVAVVEPRTTWADEGRLWARAVRRGLGDVAIDIDHVGSTAVPLLAAKEVIDLQVTVLDVAPAELIVSPMHAAGFHWVRTVRADAPRDGYPSTPQHWEKLLFREPEGARRVLVHVRKLGGASARVTLLLRDFLRADAAARDDYGAMKQAIWAALPDDKQAYDALKRPWISMVLRLAEAWASRTRWRPGAPDA
jgi:GrpB-like predicted nucleotidyltransferase (UPF0157 family)